MKIESIATQSHERVLYCSDEETGLRSYIALHDTTLGPGLGGCRMWDYATREEALADVLRLSAGMTAKAALAGMPFGGGKAVILGNAQRDKTPELMRAFGRFVDSLGGAFVTGEDVGMSPEDMQIAALETRYVSGLPTGRFAGGDPSPVTAEGVFRCMKVAAHQCFGTDDLSGRRVAIQGLGHVGMALAERLAAAGARLVVADLDAGATGRAAQVFGAEIVAPDRILQQQADIFAPCALGGALSLQSIPELSARMVCGSANNQLAGSGCSERLFERGILYCPDYVVNSGGLINVAREALRIEDPDWVEQKLAAAVETFRDLITRACLENRPPLDVADAMVAAILRRAAPRETGKAVT